MPTAALTLLARTPFHTTASSCSHVVGSTDTSSCYHIIMYVVGSPHFCLVCVSIDGWSSSGGRKGAGWGPEREGALTLDKVTVRQAVVRNVIGLSSSCENDGLICMLSSSCEFDRHLGMLSSSCEFERHIGMLSLSAYHLVSPKDTSVCYYDSCHLIV